MPLVDYVIAIWLGKSLITPFVCFVMTFIDRAFVIHSFGLLALTAAAFKAKIAALDRCCLRIAATLEPCGYHTKDLKVYNRLNQLYIPVLASSLRVGTT